MDKKEFARQIILSSNGIAKTAGFLSAGLSKTDVGKLHKDGYIKRINHGYYQLADSDGVSEEQLLATLIPEGIVCVWNPLFFTMATAILRRPYGRLPSPAPLLTAS